MPTPSSCCDNSERTMPRRLSIASSSFGFVLLISVIHLAFPAFTSRFSVVDKDFDFNFLLETLREDVPLRRTDVNQKNNLSLHNISLPEGNTTMKVPRDGSRPRLTQTKRSRAIRSSINGTNTTSDWKLHTAIVGFPKCGTSGLLAYLRTHKEVQMPKRERCEVCDRQGSSMDRLLAEELIPGNHTRGIKCPRILESTEAMKTLSSMYPGISLIIGIRHPVSWYGHGRKQVPLRDKRLNSWFLFSLQV